MTNSVAILTPSQATPTGDERSPSPADTLGVVTFDPEGCPVCWGFGAGDDGDPCPRCNGTGCVAPPPPCLQGRP
jgi:hypothetical protein